MTVVAIAVHSFTMLFLIALTLPLLALGEQRPVQLDVRTYVREDIVVTTVRGQLNASKHSNKDPATVVAILVPLHGALLSFNA